MMMMMMSTIVLEHSERVQDSTWSMPGSRSRPLLTFDCFANIWRAGDFDRLIADNIFTTIDVWQWYQYHHRRVFHISTIIVFIIFIQNAVRSRRPIHEIFQWFDRKCITEKLTQILVNVLFKTTMTGDFDHEDNMNIMMHLWRWALANCGEPKCISYSNQSVHTLGTAALHQIILIGTPECISCNSFWIAFPFLTMHTSHWGQIGLALHWTLLHASESVQGAFLAI